MITSCLWVWTIVGMNHPGLEFPGRHCLCFSDTGTWMLVQTSQGSLWALLFPLTHTFSTCTKKQIIFCFISHLVPEDWSKERAKNANYKINMEHKILPELEERSQWWYKQLKLLKRGGLAGFFNRVNLGGSVD